MKTLTTIRTADALISFLLQSESYKVRCMKEVGFLVVNETGDHMVAVSEAAVHQALARSVLKEDGTKDRGTVLELVRGASLRSTASTPSRMQ